MKYNIITEYPLWFMFFCILLGAGTAILLYYRNNKDNISPILKKILAVIRFFTVTVISFLLLSPLIKSVNKYVEKPVIIIAQDNSESILFNKDSLYYINQYPQRLNKLISDLKTKYDVKTYSFGDNITDELKYFFNDKITDISAFFEKIQTIYSNRNVGAMILATDGIYNKGKNPLYVSDFASFPIYTLALGDTTIYKDLIISKVNCNTTAYIGNKFPVEVVVTANKCKGTSTNLIVYKGNEIVFTKNISITTSSFTQTVLFEIEAKQTGIQLYRAFLTPLKDEITIMNNAKDFYVNVIDKKQKILILVNAPNPDIAAIKLTLEKNINYNVESFIADNYTGSLKDYNLVILYQLPSIKNSLSKIFEILDKSELPAIYILGVQTDFNIFNGRKTGLNITANNKSSMNEAVPIINNDFSLFTLNENIKQYSDLLPPLYSAFGTYKTSNSANILFYQKIGSVNTKQPLILFNQHNNIKTCVIAGEGLWKWKLTEYMYNKNHDIFNEMIGKIVQYLVVTEDRSFFRVFGRNNFYENENVEFDAELYNDSYEIINDIDVSLAIYNKENKKYSFVFSKTANAYHLNAGIFPTGEYRYKAIVNFGNKKYTKNGIFNILNLNIESLSLTADHKLLYNISRKHKGNMFYVSQMEKLFEDINNRDDIKSVSYNQKKLNDVVNLLWVLILIIFLLSVEWLFRKWSGNY